MKSLYLIKFKVYLFLLLILAPENSVFGEERVADLQQKLAEISLLQNQLNERKSEAIAIREKLYLQLANLTKEIKTIITQEKITSYSSSLANPRVRHNLKLSAEISNYIDQFNQKIRFYQIGQDKLDYLFQRADDDLKIIHTLTNLKIEALLVQIEAVIFEYLPEAHRILIHLDDLEKIDTSMIWKKVNQN